jgi:hypothetical protein
MLNDVTEDPDVVELLALIYEECEAQRPPSDRAVPVTCCGSRAGLTHKGDSHVWTW